ncbi:MULTISPECIES: hypothetical protein [Streptomyces]|uniref:hypothetical protein n=1 Tax=Streptomyces TaxID=1883 RepID=UPI0004AAF23B|nr:MULTISPECIES: hypothetical protein [Streptomyces]
MGTNGDGGDGGGGGNVVITDGYLDDFATKKFADLIGRINKDATVVSLRQLGTGAIPFLDGTDSERFKSASGLADAVKAYCGAIDGILTAFGKQLTTLSTDLHMADLYLNNAKDQALDYAQFMKLAERTLNPGPTKP